MAFLDPCIAEAKKDQNQFWILGSFLRGIDGKIGIAKGNPQMLNLPPSRDVILPIKTKFLKRLQCNSHALQNGISYDTYVMRSLNRRLYHIGITAYFQRFIGGNT